MSEWRTFEKRTGDVVRRWQIRRDGIRCHMAWGLAGGATRGSSMTLDDEAHAERHFAKKIREKERQGYVEVGTAQARTPSWDRRPAALPDDATLLDVIRDSKKNHYEGAFEAFWDRYEPLPAHPGAHVAHHQWETDGPGPGPFREFLVLVDDERKGLEFTVGDPGYDAKAVSDFLDFVIPRWKLAFDGTSHHKLALDTPIGPFGHVLFCGPSLVHGPDHGGRVGMVFPVHDCEIAAADTETWVEARIKGRDSIPHNDWDREPYPVTDLRFELVRTLGTFERFGRAALRQRKFKTGGREALEQLLPLLIESTPESRVEVRNFRGETMAVTRRDLTPDTLPAIDAFVRGVS